MNYFETHETISHFTEEQKSSYYNTTRPIYQSIIQMKLTIHFYYMVFEQEAEKNRSLFTIYSSGARERKRSYLNLFLKKLPLPHRYVRSVLKVDLAHKLQALHKCAVLLEKKYDEWRKIFKETN